MSITQSGSDNDNSINSIPAPTLRSPSSRTAMRARQINFKKLPYIRLPKAPLAWEESRRQSEEHREAEKKVQTTDADAKATRSSLPRFIVLGNGWNLATEEALSPIERPDPAYRQVFHTAGSTIWIDPKGQRVGFPSASAVALSTDRTGAKVAERGLTYDIYRSDVNADGSGMLFLSRDGILHGYTETIEPIVAEALTDIPEYAEQSKRFGIGSSQLKNHTRCVAISSDRSRSLITVVDEAWCYDVITGKPIWGLRFPSKEGWTQIAADRSEATGASAEITAALRLMELTLPVSPEAITRQYKTLAMRWHPDRNPQNPNATRQFQDLGAALRLLTGIDLSRLSSSQIESVAYEQMLHQSSVKLPNGQTITLTMSLQVSGSFAVDWIYAANFAHTGHSTFLSGYSGRIIEVDSSGNPLRVYDIGALPREVADTPLHRYILTDTRLYVLSGDKLVALIDVFDKGKLIVGNQGFGLLQPKQFQWFTPTGELLGEVQTRDPIRRTYSGSQGLVVETRSHRGIISGAQSWW